MRRSRRLARVLLCCVLAGALCEAQGRGFRHLQALGTPVDLPEGAEAVEQRRPVDRQLVIRAMDAMARGWNTGSIDRFLAPEFVDRQRLLDTLATVVPGGARLRITGVGAVSTVEQYLHGGRRVSLVLVDATTQIEFNDVRHGFQRLQGSNQYLLRITEALP
ncbi:hypothetical protein [Alkalilimnicola sp. S0819]|uniref:hypothetical protein n=1 Tax=Alkalilimnicola sp. S0819 TaxID=2613922 RepID=UPI001261865A|nr:hypothetical protein [Alkalilimnicola sp. S0819]KAB7627795.1 hypothetical protein F3N43_02125 [Alkalilimnicola sp. S0819]MPQ15425.1 hypothetical protein [Alkalilimnicola sp. S0819]